mmetsp:Transcript_13792/g.28314  ORF Transcript_13792/g.28314 Transcript_13792/m.28314 type:complete len:234 (+) Transcript_13792:334-1035(+)
MGGCWEYGFVSGVRVQCAAGAPSSSVGWGKVCGVGLGKVVVVVRTTGWGRKSLLCMKGEGEGKDVPELLAKPSLPDDGWEEEIVGEGDEEGLVLRRPDMDPTSLRTESQNRRMSPVKDVRRKRKPRKRNAETAASKLDWDTMEKRQLVRGGGDAESGEDFWLDLAEATEQLEEKQRRVPPKPIDPELKMRLKNEVVEPYKNNWILVAIALVAGLAVLYQLFPTDIPIIPIPDL